VAGLAVVAFVLSCGVNTAKAMSVEIRFDSLAMNGSNWDWKYEVVLTPGNFVSVNSFGDTIGLFDIDGYVVGSYQWLPTAVVYAKTSETDAGLDYSFTGSPAGATPGATDLPLPDLRFTYTGLPFVNATTGNVLLGYVQFTSIYNTAAKDLAWTSDTKIGGLTNGLFQQIIVPRDGGFPAVPLPAPLLAGSALMSMLGFRRATKTA